LSDHWDSHLEKPEKGSRSICKHGEECGNNTKHSFYPYGCTDGKVVDTNLAKQLAFEGRFGSSCGRIFRAKKHIKKYPKYQSWAPFLEDIPCHSWTLLQKK
jgi:hypothetical protein